MKYDDPQQRDEIRTEFNRAVNMSPAQLEDWLATEQSQSVGAGARDGESVGHASGRRIIEIKRTNKDDLSDDDFDHMRTVVGYIHRHLRQGAPATIRSTRAGATRS
jgi:hypothetical protein